VLQPDGVTTKPPTCIFCGTDVGPFDREDVLPKWLRKVLPSEFKVFLTSMEGGVRPARSNVLRAIIRRGGICKGCNGGWMSGLEKALIPTLRPMVNARRARPVPLSMTQQRTVAFWALEKALCLELAARQHDRNYLHGYIPPGQLAWLYDHREGRRPSPGTQVWLFAFQAQEPGEPGVAMMASHGSVTIADDFAEEPDAPESAIATLATLTVGTLGFQVFARDLSRPGEVAKPPLEPPGWLRPILVPIWPPLYPAAHWLATGPRGVVGRSAVPTLLTWGSDFAPPS
jgi:hypothetical protein